VHLSEAKAEKYLMPGAELPGLRGHGHRD
jgi:hypothetical protein